METIVIWTRKSVLWKHSSYGQDNPRFYRNNRHLDKLIPVVWKQSSSGQDNTRFYGNGNSLLRSRTPATYAFGVP